MRQERTVQASLFDLFAGHEIGRELKAMSAWLDDHRELASLVAADLRRDGVKETGRQGLPAEAVLRCAVLKQHRQLSYQELAFHLEDSASFRAFARLPHAWSPQKSVLHQTISAIRAETWEQIHRALLASARHEKLESGRLVRLARLAPSPAVGAPGGAARGHRGADARAERQQPAVGCGPRDGAPAAGGASVAWRGQVLVARSSAGSEEARPGDPVHPSSAQTGPAVPGADQPHASDVGLSATDDDAPGDRDRPGSRALAGMIVRTRVVLAGSAGSSLPPAISGS